MKKNILSIFYIFNFYSRLSFLFTIFLVPVQSQEVFSKKIGDVIIDVSRHDRNVKHNLQLALQKIENYKLPPSSTFSFNQTIGEGSAENHFLSASVYFGGESVSEPGGGLCILATAIYNLLLQGNFTIVQRAKHSKPVSYIAGGLDATISYGKTDLKMKNSEKLTFFIKGRLNEQKLHLELYANVEMEFEYEPRVETQSEIHSQEEVGAYKSGKMVEVYLDKKREGVVIESKHLYTEYLRPFFQNPSKTNR